ncbi:hypothetical protein D2V84_00275 [Burkholderia pseudomallei]|nr:hypothetical protein D2W72_02305 [Burkholderia pseudomallei]RIV88523.1 hypothetical protein D2V84_00275 [Burkholderia pseudomallei]
MLNAAARRSPPSRLRLYFSQAAKTKFSTTVTYGLSTARSMPGTPTNRSRASSPTFRAPSFSAHNRVSRLLCARWRRRYRRSRSIT